MLALLQRLSLPLLLRELLEQATRRRTYVIRVVYAMLFFIACLLMILPEMSRAGSSPLGVLGTGRYIFLSIVSWQFAGIYLFIPALTCGVLTVEKERNTLGLLFLTKLGSWTIILEKLLSRLLPMYALMLCSLLAFSMSFGGVNPIDMLIGTWFLALTAFQICSIAVACSAVFRTTTGALLACYAVMFLLGFGAPTLDWLLLNNAATRSLQSRPSFGPIPAGAVLYSFVGFVGFIIQTQGGVVGLNRLQSFVLSLFMGVPLVCSGVLALFVARLCLVRRAFLPASNTFLKLLRSVDRIFQTLNNNRVTRGIVLIPDSTSEPDFSPIAWRETHKRSLGQTRYLIRILLLLELPVLLVIIRAVTQVFSSNQPWNVEVSITTSLVWLVSALLITITSAGLIAGERGRETLDVLLTLPMSGREILLNKVAGVYRLAWICAVPLVTCIVFGAWWRDIMQFQERFGHLRPTWWEYLFSELSMVVIYLPLMAWLALWVGLKIKSPTRAVLGALIAVVAWCVIPIMVITTIWNLFVSPNRNICMDGYGVLLQLSPLALLATSEGNAIRELSQSPLFPMLINILLYGGGTLLLRAWILASADQLLGRTPSRSLRQVMQDWLAGRRNLGEYAPRTATPEDEVFHA
ncbi:MAG: ABC transporter permease subunit [Planctomycetota bacterium]